MASPEFQEWPGIQGAVWNVASRSWARDNGPRGVGRRKGDPFAFPSQRVAVARLWIQFLRELLWSVAVKLGF